MGFALFALISAISVYASSESNRRQQEYASDVAKKNAMASDQEAALLRKQTEIARQAADRDKTKTKRAYISAAGTNMNLITGGNVDPSSGSALALLEGNLNRYADDMGELEYDKELATWTGNRQAQIKDWEADMGFNNASFLSRTAGSVGQSLLTGAAAGASSYYGAKSAAGSSAAPTVAGTKLKQVSPSKGTFNFGVN